MERMVDRLGKMSVEVISRKLKAKGFTDKQIDEAFAASYKIVEGAPEVGLIPEALITSVLVSAYAVKAYDEKVPMEKVRIPVKEVEDFVKDVKKQLIEELLKVAG